MPFFVLLIANIMLLQESMRKLADSFCQGATDFFRKTGKEYRRKEEKTSKSWCKFMLDKRQKEVSCKGTYKHAISTITTNNLEYLLKNKSAKIARIASCDISSNCTNTTTTAAGP